MAPGDIQFVHNHTLLHDRTAFVDGEGGRRHLLRAWIAAEGARPLPDLFAVRWGSTQVGARGGVGLAGQSMVLNLYANEEDLAESQRGERLE